jgi:hypothetical protein
MHFRQGRILWEVERVRIRHRCNKILSDVSFYTNFYTFSRIVRHYVNLTSLIQMKGVTVLFPRIILFITRRLFRLNCAGHRSFANNCYILPHSVFYTCEKFKSLISILVFHTTDDMVGRTKKEENTNPPPLYDTSQRYLQHLSMCSCIIKIGQNYPFRIPTEMRTILMTWSLAVTGLPLRV